MSRAALLILVLAGCLDVPSGPAPECAKSSDCDTANGEVCDEGTCYGNPPDGMYAVVISPPASRKDLVPRELTMPAIADDGWIADLTLAKPSMVTGRVEATCILPMGCDRSSLATTITIVRPSSFKGGPTFKVVADSDASSQAVGPSFDIALPKTGANDQPYVVTVLPKGRGDEPTTGGKSPAELYPPMRFTLLAKDNTITKMIQLGGANLPTIDGSVLSPASGGLSHYRVVAMGRWETGAPATEVSTVDYTAADGKFHIILSDSLVGSVELIAKPAPSGSAAPTLHAFDVPSYAPSLRTLQQPSSLGAQVTRTFQVNGVDGSGSITGVRGANVKISATIGGRGTGQTLSTFTAEGTADDHGSVRLDLLDGPAITGLYKLQVVPPASSPMGVVFSQPLDYAIGTALLLPTRIALRGKVTDVNGEPLKDVSVTARPSLRFTWSFEDAPQAFVSTIPAATTLTPATGEFALWVDPTVDGLWGHYDLAFEPASKARAPSWVQGDIEIPRDLSKTTVTVDEIRLPDAAAIRGTVLDPSGIEVEGAEVKIFRLNTSLALCSEVLNPPLSCPIPAVLQGRGNSDASGVVRLTLPR